MPIPERLVRVEILGQRYPIRSTLDEAYISELATYVDDKMHVAADTAPTEDTLRVAVLAALNIADEYFKCRNEEGTSHEGFAARLAKIEALIDQALSSES